MAQEAGTSFNASRRGFLGGTALAAAGAAIGGILPSAMAPAFRKPMRKPPPPPRQRVRNI